MYTRETIEDLARKLAAVASPKAKIVLFGSHARGDATPASDVDFLVLEPEIADRKQEYFNLIDAMGTHTVDVLLMRQSDFDQRVSWFGSLPYRVQREGVVLHG
jgi:uncharacterized protein